MNWYEFGVNVKSQLVFVTLKLAKAMPIALCYAATPGAHADRDTNIAPGGFTATTWVTDFTITTVHVIMRLQCFPTS